MNNLVRFSGNKKERLTLFFMFNSDVSEN